MDAAIVVSLIAAITTIITAAISGYVALQLSEVKATTSAVQVTADSTHALVNGKSDAMMARIARLEKLLQDSLDENTELRNGGTE